MSFVSSNHFQFIYVNTLIALLVIDCRNYWFSISIDFKKILFSFSFHRFLFLLFHFVSVNTTYFLVMMQCGTGGSRTFLCLTGCSCTFATEATHLYIDTHSYKCWQLNSLIIKTFTIFFCNAQWEKSLTTLSHACTHANKQLLYSW